LNLSKKQLILSLRVRSPAYYGESSFGRKPETRNLTWLPNHADCKKLSIYSQLQVRHDTLCITVIRKCRFFTHTYSCSFLKINVPQILSLSIPQTRSALLHNSTFLVRYSIFVFISTNNLFFLFFRKKGSKKVQVAGGSPSLGFRTKRVITAEKRITSANN
jgi:hypothetical protein